MNPQPEHVGPRVERVGKEGDQVPSPLDGRAGPLLPSFWGTGSPFWRLKERWWGGVSGVSRFTPFLVQAPRGLSPWSPALGFLIS